MPVDKISIITHYSKKIPKQLIKFLIVGFLGTLTNLGIFFILVDLLLYNHIIVAIGAFTVSAAQNYWLNHKWTFSQVTLNKTVSFRGYFKYLTVSIGGLIVNLILLTVIIHFFNPAWKVIAQAIGISGGTVVNYLGSKYWVFLFHD